MRDNLTLEETTLACVLPGYNAVLVLEKRAVHPQWREDDGWETAELARTEIKNEFPDVQFVCRRDFQDAYAKRKRQPKISECRRTYVVFSEARYAQACSVPPREWEEEIELTVIDETATRGCGEMFMRWYRIGDVLCPYLEISPDGWRILANLTPSILEELGAVDNQDITPAYFRTVLDRCDFVDETPRD